MRSFAVWTRGSEMQRVDADRRRGRPRTSSTGTQSSRRYVGATPLTHFHALAKSCTTQPGRPVPVGRRYYLRYPPLNEKWTVISVLCCKLTALPPQRQHCPKIMKPPQSFTTVNGGTFTSSSARLSSQSRYRSLDQLLTCFNVIDYRDWLSSK